MSDTPKWGVTERITAYLASGGLFNPELANHDAVRDLLMDARDELAGLADCINTELRDAGYHVPEDVFDLIREEIAESSLSIGDHKP